MADRIVVMNHGGHRSGRHAARNLRRPATPFVADFIGKVNVLPATCDGGGQLPCRHRLARGRRDRDIVAGTAVQAVPAARGHRGPSRTGPHRGDAQRGPESWQGRFPGHVLHDRNRRVDAARRPALVANVPRNQTVDAARSCAGHAVTVRSAAARRCACSGVMARSPPRCCPAPSAPAVTPLVHWQRPARAGRCSSVACALVRVPAGAARGDPGRERAGQVRRVRRPRCSFASISQRRRSASSIWNTLWVGAASRRSRCRWRSSTLTR